MRGESRSLGRRVGAVEDGEEGVDDGGVELRAPAALEFGAGCVVPECLAVDTVGGHRLVRVGHRQDPCLQRHLLAREPERIAAAVRALVMGEDPVPHVVEHVAAKDARADLRVAPHLGVLVVGERPRLVENRVGHADLADVVQQARHADALHVAGIHAELLGHHRRVPGDGLRVRRRAGVAQVEGFGEADGRDEPGAVVVAVRCGDRGGGTGRLRGEHRAVTAAALGTRESAVGGDEEFVERLAVPRVHRDAERHRHGVRVVAEGEHDVAPQALCECDGVGDLGGGREDRELFAAGASGDVEPSRAAGDHVRGAAEHSVPRGAAVRLVDALELVEITDDERAARTGGVRHMRRGAALEAHAVEQAGERVGPGGALELVLEGPLLLDQALALTADAGEEAAGDGDRPGDRQPALDAHR